MALIWEEVPADFLFFPLFLFWAAPRGASSIGKGARRAVPDRQARVLAQKRVWWGSARARGLFLFSSV